MYCIETCSIIPRLRPKISIQLFTKRFSAQCDTTLRPR